MGNMKVAIVAPVHIQPSEEWVKALWDESVDAKADVIIVDDSDGKVELPWGAHASVYGYEKQKAEMGEELYAMFEQFHKSSSCKNFGIWLAWRDGYDYIIVIDSDCIVPKHFVAEHVAALNIPGDGWENPLAESGWYSRGFPFSKRGLPKWAHMGLWTGALDLYGTDRVKNPDKKEDDPKISYLSSPAKIPLSGMNVSFVREAVPYMLFLPNFSYNRHKFRRCDDIWGGYIFQKIMEQKGASLSFGKPWVKHDSKIVAEEDAKEEEAMIKFEDDFCRAIDNCLVFTGTGCKEHNAPQIFGWLSQELGAHEIFEELRTGLLLHSKLYA